MNITFKTFCLVFVIPLTLFAQPEKPLLGYWEGAFIKNNAYQKVNIRFYKKGKKLVAFQYMEEWYPSFGEFGVVATQDTLGNTLFNTGYGKAKVRVDVKNQEIIGQIIDSNPSIYIHLKKSPPPPDNYYTVKPITFKNKEITLQGHLHVPTFGSRKTAIILVGGRGCYAGNTQHDLYAKFFRKYGITTLVFNKRGTGKSTGDCSKATINNLASDLVAAKKFLQKHPDKYQKIGVLGSSAGGWVMVKAQETTSFDFMISVVGPSTSVYEQQMQSLDYGAKFYQMNASTKKRVKDYTNMMFKAPANQASFQKFKKMLELAKKEDWLKILEGTDQPKNITGIDQLWVRRHSYDPANVLKKYSHPFLAIYGQRDWIVPYKENIARLEQLFSGNRNKLLNTVIAHNAEHGMEMEGKYIQLPKGQSYWHFYRISPSVKIEILKFLRKYKLL